MIDEKRKVILDKLLEECKQMYIDKSWPVSEDEIVEHTGIRGSFEFGYLCGSLHQRNKVWHDSNKEQPKSECSVVIWNPVTMDGEILSRCVEVFPNRIWAYTSELLPIKESEYDKGRV